MEQIPSSRDDYNITLEELLRDPLLKKMLVDIAHERKISLVPGNGGRDCPGNWEFCDECDYQICCFDSDMCDKCFAENGACEIETPVQA